MVEVYVSRLRVCWRWHRTVNVFDLHGPLGGGYFWFDNPECTLVNVWFFRIRVSLYTLPQLQKTLGLGGGQAETSKSSAC